jgi:hypothetical protein
MFLDKSLPQIDEPSTDTPSSSMSTSAYELYECRPVTAADRSTRPGHYATLGSVRATKGVGASAIREDWPDEGPVSGRVAELFLQCHF